MFGNKAKPDTRSQQKRAVSAALLQRLVGPDPQSIGALTAIARLVDYPPGTIAVADHDEVAYLAAGALRFVTQSGAAVTLTSEQAAARYPLPCGHRIARIEAAKGSRLIWLPRTAMAQRQPTTPEPPKLTGSEESALTELRGYFDSPHYELPSLPDLAIKIGDAIDKNTTTSDDIARLIQLDPVLSTRMLSVVNSAAFGGVNRITSIQQATTRLGRSKVRSLVFSCLLKSIFRVSGGDLQRRMEAVWQHSVKVAALSYVLGKVTPGIDAEQTMLAGLVHDIGGVAVIGAISRFPQLAVREQVFEHVVASLRITAATRAITHWGLEQELGAVVRDAHFWQRTGTALADDTDIVIVARLHAAFGTPQAHALPRLDALPAFSKLANGDMTPRQSLAVLDRAAADVREVQALIAQ